MGLRIGSLCSGYRGLDMAVEQVFGGTTAWVSDVDPGASKILAHHWPDTPNLGDLTAVDWHQVLDMFGRPHIVLGGYPCQPFSTAGQRKGTDDARHLWPHIAHALSVLRPRYAIFENVANHVRLGFAEVLTDLARLGFDAEWALVRASEIGAPHPRRRLFILATAADASDLRHERGRGPRRGWPGPANGREFAADPDGGRGRTEQRRIRQGQPDAAWGRYLSAVRRWERILGRPAPRATDDQSRLSPAFVEWMMGLPRGWVTAVPDLTRTEQLRALGNGVVPQQAAAALQLLADRAAAAA